MYTNTGARGLLIATLAVVAPYSARAFNFAYTTPAQCGQFTVTWEGGTGPYSLLITPFFMTPHNVTIPDSSYSNGKGSYTFAFPVQQQKRFVLTMSDSTGFGAGGTSGILTVNNAGADADPNCKPDDATPPFTFNTPNALQQCRPYIFNNYSGATQPITIYGLIPQGTPFTLHPPTGSTSYTWTADVAAGTELIFTMTDAAGRSGGAGDLTPMGSSDDSSCLDSTSPSSVGGTATVLPSGSATTTAKTGDDDKGSSSNGAVIGGAVGGSVVLLLILGALILFCKRKRRGGHTRTTGKRIDLLPGETVGHGAHGSDYEPVPFVLPPQSNYRDEGDVENGEHSSYRYATGSDSAPNSQGYAAGGAKNPQGPSPAPSQRFIVHTDGGSAVGPDVEEEELVELPPQYTAIKRDGSNNAAGPSASRS